MTHQFWPRFVLWSTVFGLIAAPALPAFATDVVVSTPVTTTQTLDGNDSLSVSYEHHHRQLCQRKNPHAVLGGLKIIADL